MLGQGNMGELAKAQQALVERLELAEARALETDKIRRQELSEAAKTSKLKVQEAERRVRHQLSYRFGHELLRAFKNPLRFVALPYFLVRQWRSFRSMQDADSGAAASPVPEAVDLGTDNLKPEPVIDADLAREMSPEALDALSHENLRQLERWAGKEGDPNLQLRTAKARWNKRPAEAETSNLRIKTGRMVELDTDWLPPLASRPIGKTDPNRILHIFKTLYPLESTGGAVRNWSIATNQRHHGLFPAVAVPPGVWPSDRRSDSRRQGLGQGEKDGVDIHFCHFENFPSIDIPRDVLLTFETKLLAHICDAVKPSIIHAASGYRGYDNALKGLALARSRQLPMVYEVRSFHEHIWGPLFEGIVDAPATRLRMKQEDRCMAEADAVVTTSECMVEELIARGVQQEKLFVVPNCVDDKFRIAPDISAREKFRSRWGLTGKKVIGYISNMSRREGHSVLMEAFLRLKASDRDDLRLLLVGEGKMESELKAFAAEQGLGSSVIFTGAIDHEDILPAYAAIDIFVVPRLPDYASDYGTPMKAFEAMAVGAPLVMSDRPVTREVLGDQERGLCFRTGDPDELAQAVGAILDNPEKARSRAEQARSWVIENRSWRSNIVLYEEVYAAARERHADRFVRL